MPVLTAFAAADSGNWRIERIDAVRGASLPAGRRPRGPR
jgi:hypothetical protein